MILAKELMSSPVRYLYSSDTLKTAIELFEKRQFRTMPILSPAGKILGVLSELSLLKCLITSRAKATEELQIFSFVQFLEKPSLVIDRDNLGAVVKVMAQSRSNRVLVVDSNEKLLGVISPKDIISSIVSSKESSPSLQHQVDTLERERAVLREEYDRLVHHQKSLQEFQDVMQSSLFLCHSVGIDGTIRFANSRLHEILEYANGSLIGKSFTDIYPDHIHADVRKSLADLKLADQQKVMYSALKTKSGESIKVEITSVALRDSSGAFIGTATISRVIDAGLMMKLLSGAFRHDREV